MLSTVGGMQDFFPSLMETGSCTRKQMDQTSGVSASSLGKSKVHTGHILSSDVTYFECMVPESAG